MKVTLCGKKDFAHVIKKGFWDREIILEYQRAQCKHMGLYKSVQKIQSQREGDVMTEAEGQRERDLKTLALKIEEAGSEPKNVACRWKLKVWEFPLWFSGIWCCLCSGSGCCWGMGLTSHLRISICFGCWKNKTKQNKTKPERARKIRSFLEPPEGMQPHGPTLDLWLAEL